ncbi:MAG TPA: outer membrane beta-barrel protein [Candidatus Acidoferrum sp.]
MSCVPQVYRSIALFFLFTVAASLEAEAQEVSSRFEVGGEFSGISLLNSNNYWAVSPGFGGRFDFNLNRRMALDVRLDFFPQGAPSRYQSQGGKTLQFSGGLRGKFIQTNRFAVYGVVLPGLLHFSNTVTSLTTTVVPGTSPPVIIINAVHGSATHFAVDLGGGVEWYPTRRSIVRVEFGGELYTIPGRSVLVNPSNPLGLSLILPADIARTWQFSVGVGYRASERQDEIPERQVSGRWEFGPQFASMLFVSALPTENSRREPGFGGFLSYELFRYVYADAALNFYPREGHSFTPFDGGRVLQSLGGFKIGSRKGRYGFFGKARAGLDSFSKTVASFSVSPPSVTDTRSHTVALDLGGAFELYVKRRMMLRFDASDILNFYHDVEVLFNGQLVRERAPMARTDAIQMSVGFGWRF